MKPRTQQRNANRHTDRGMALLAESIEADGTIGAITVAANGETFDGSARLAVLGPGLDDAIIVESDGTRPIVHVRTDIATADDPRAIRLGLSANRVAELNLSWNEALLAELAAQDATLLEGLFRQDELDALLASVAAPIMPGAGGDEFDATPADGPTRTQAGDLWQLGRHRLLVGDCTDPANVARLMDGKRADLCFTSPPYNAGDSEKLTGNTHSDDTKYIVGGKDNLSDDEYLLLLCGATTAALLYCDYVFINIQPIAGNKIAIIDFQYRYRDHFADIAIWDKTHAQPAMARRVMNSQFEYIFILSSQEHPTRAVGSNDFRGTVPNVYSAPPQRNNEYSNVHAATFPLHLPEWGLSNFTKPGDIVYDPFLGSGTTLIAAERTGRTCYGCEISEVYADVILRRWEAETGQAAQKVEP